MPSTPSPTFDLTLFPSIFALEGTSKAASWADLASAFGEHLVAPDKVSTPGFGPYALRARPCAKPRHPKGPHRCDDCVDALTLAVFDVDCGTYAEVEKCDAALAGYARLWYSSFSYRPEAERPSLRLVVPLLRPVPAERWASWRTNFIRAFHVPADPKKCGGLSHFYYAPSCPPGIEPVAVAHEGPCFDPDTVPSTAHRRPAPVHLVEPVDPSEPDTERLRHLRGRLAQTLAGLARSSKLESMERRLLLERLVEGLPLAVHGSRNQTTTRVVFFLVQRFEDLTQGECIALVEPSVRAMQREGSRLTTETVARMYETAYAKLAAQREADARIEQLLRERLGLPPA